MNSSYLRRVASPVFKVNSKRSFSLLVPLEGKANLPAEIKNTPLTDRYFNDLKVQY